MRPAPEVAIVTATYNRSKALACAIEGVRRQTFQNWEMVVVGDRCTDDTAEVIARIGDDRIRFVNLERNVGEQSGPNNVGVQLTTAPIVAFVNHDDIWLPHHLQLCVDQLAVHHADVVFGTAASVGADAPLPLRFDALGLALIGLSHSGGYEPWELERSIVPASATVMKRTVFEKLHGFRLASQIHIEPSQDLMFRALRAGFRIRAVNLVTVVLIVSGHRHGSYVSGRADEQQWLLDQLAIPGFDAELAAQALETNAAFVARSQTRSPRWARQVARLLTMCGVNPRTLVFRLRRGFRPGAYVTGLRNVRGLPDITSPNLPGPALRFEAVRRSCRISCGEVVRFAAGAGGARFTAAGWSRPDDERVWSDGPNALLWFDLGVAPQSDVVLDVEVEAFLGDGNAARRIAISAAGMPLDRWELSASTPWSHRLVVPPSSIKGSLLQLEFAFENPQSPHAAGISDDRRELSIGLRSVRLEWSGEG